jgi:hypothetical protein
MYRPNRTNDYQYLDKIIYEQYTVGGIDIFVHKYLGPILDPEQTNNPGDATLPTYDTTNPLFIEDLLLLENRDRAYDPDVYIMRGVYRTQDIDFDLTQFGLFLNNDTLFITFHYNNMIDTLGRKLMSGDVIEVPNLKDYHPLDRSIPNALPRYYVIQDGNCASEGFSQTWLPHLWRVKATPLVNAQEFNQILNQPFMPENIWDNGNFYPGGETVNNGGTYYVAKQNVPPGIDITDADYWRPVVTPATVGDQTSTRLKDLEINDALLVQAQSDVPLSGYDVTKFYILPTADGQPAGAGPAPDDRITPKSFGYTMGYLVGDGQAPNGLPVTPGVHFPPNPTAGDYALRLDYFPNRLFRFSGTSWVKIEDNVRTDLDLATGALTQRAGFVNNTYTVATSDQGNIPSRQSLSQILKPQADNGNQGGNLSANPRPPGR